MFLPLILSGLATFGFLDETSLQLDPSRKRMINTPEVKYKPGEIRSKTIFGFMPFNGNGTAMLSYSSTRWDMLAFIKQIRNLNPFGPIVILIDNARIHHAKVVMERIKNLDVHFVYLPPYSPDLNPIEYANKDIKAELSNLLDFDEMVEASEGVALDMFKNRKFSYTKSWREKFMPEYEYQKLVK